MNPKVLGLNPEIRPLNPRVFAPNPQKTVIYPRAYNPRQIMRLSYKLRAKNPKKQKPCSRDENRVLINAFEKLTF
jgi:hypothetical protein